MADQDRHGRVVVWDPHGEPIAWLAVGEPVLGTMYNGAGMAAYTHVLTVEEATDAYGPITEWVVGPGGGFRRVCFGTTWFSTAELFRGFNRESLPTGVVTVEDPDLEWPCPRCDAHPVRGVRAHPSTKSGVRTARNISACGPMPSTYGIPSPPSWNIQQEPRRGQSPCPPVLATDGDGSGVGSELALPNSMHACPVTAGFRS